VEAKTGKGGEGSALAFKNIGYFRLSRKMSRADYLRARAVGERRGGKVNRPKRVFFALILKKWEI
jgi:hypothetical protein